jgi:uncharacterized membrane protein
MYGVDTVKSVILTLAASERIITIEEAVALSRLEEEYQVLKLIIIIFTMITNYNIYLSDFPLGKCGVVTRTCQI